MFILNAPEIAVFRRHTGMHSGFHFPSEPAIKVVYVLESVIIPAAGYTLPYIEAPHSGADDIKYICKNFSNSSSSGLRTLIRQLDGSLGATSTRTSATSLKTRKRPVQRQFFLEQTDAYASSDFEKEAQMRTGTRSTPVNRSSIEASRLTGLPLVLAALPGFS